jgi:hypothetical protein
MARRRGIRIDADACLPGAECAFDNPPPFVLVIPP